MYVKPMYTGSNRIKYGSIYSVHKINEEYFAVGSEHLIAWT